MVLTQSHMESLSAHTMQCFELPQGTSKYLDKCNRDFFQKKSDLEKGLLIPQGKICLPKSKGGLGLPKTAAVNKAFQSKLAWKVLTDAPSLQVQSMRAKHLLNSDLLSYKRKNNDSPVWKSILKVRDLLKTGICWKIGKGDQISFWFDNWIKNKNLVEIMGIDEENIPQPDAKVCDFITQQSQWHVQHLKLVLSNHPIIQKIQGISIPVHGAEDSFYWGLNSSGDFPTRSTTWAAHDGQFHETSKWSFN